MTSHVALYIEYLIPTAYLTLKFEEKNIDSLACRFWCDWFTIRKGGGFTFLGATLYIGRRSGDDVSRCDRGRAGVSRGGALRAGARSRWTDRAAAAASALNALTLPISTEALCDDDCTPRGSAPTCLSNMQCCRPAMSILYTARFSLCLPRPVNQVVSDRLWPVNCMREFTLRDE